MNCLYFIFYYFDNNITVYYNFLRGRDVGGQDVGSRDVGGQDVGCRDVRFPVLKNTILRWELKGKARTRPEIMRVVLGPCTQCCPCETL